MGRGRLKDLAKTHGNVRSRKEWNGLRMPQRMKWAKDAQWIEWAGEAQDVIWTDPAGILGSVN